ncbi:hypothetical protein INT45_008084 [Circinella minor]|uniref:Uncharacterized protein n=1 Tax=Circinella minor TaxID=1195481 RepID=A0A8H7RUW4_9FUNG|nr:hypothetical protein INT45_008084 [Circinella minor]
MFRHQLSRLTSYTFKYTGMGGTTSQQEQDTLPSPQLIEYWVAEAQRGLDALLNDQFDQAETILSQHASISPFHAVAYALMAYVEAMLAFDIEKIRIASARIVAAEDLARQYGRRARKRGWNGNPTIPLTTTTTTSATSTPSLSPEEDNDEQISITFNDDENNTRKSHKNNQTIDFIDLSTTTASSSSSSSTSSSSCCDSNSSNVGNKSNASSSSINSIMTAPEEQDQEVPLEQQQQQPTTETKTTKDMRKTFDLQCELLEINCILMGATTQFMGNSWLEYMKATYRLRKSYKMYEHMFTNLTGQKPSDFATVLKKQNGRRKQKQESEKEESKPPLSSTGATATTTRQFMKHSSFSAATSSSTKKNEKRFSLFGLPTAAGNLRRKPSSIRSWNSSRRSSSSSSCIYNNTNNNNNNTETNEDNDKYKQQQEDGKQKNDINKILNTLGFHSSRPFALHVLQKSYQSDGLYSGLSALTLLVYFTNLSLFIHPRLLPNSMTPETARTMLNHMKIKYPNSKIWELLEGKLCKMEGKPRKGVEILRDARRRHSIYRVDLGGGTKKWVNLETTDHEHQTEESKRNRLVISELAQLQGLAIYEMGWAQVFLGDYFQASETFFRLESMNNWSRAFYHYIATCCMFADEQYDKAGMEFQQIPNILERKRQLGGRLLPNEMFAERKIKRWKEKAHTLLSQGNYVPPHLKWMPAAATTTTTATTIPASQQSPQQRQQSYMQERYLLLDGELLKQVVTVNPLWELTYLWNGIPQLSKEMLNTMKEQLQSTINEQEKQQQQQEEMENGRRQYQSSDLAILQVILGAVLREQGDFAMAEKYFQSTIVMDSQIREDRWVVPYAMYELAVLNCFRIQQSINTDLQHLIPEIRSLIKQAEQYFQHARRNGNQTNNDSDNDEDDNDDLSATPNNNNNNSNTNNNHNNTDPSSSAADEGDHHDWDSRLHIRCQLLMEKVDELSLCD